MFSFFRRCVVPLARVDLLGTMSGHTPDELNSLRLLRHDIKGCLNSVMLSIEVLSEDLEPEEAVDFLDGLIRATDKLVVLLDQLPYDS